MSADLAGSSDYEKATRRLFFLGADQWLTWRDYHRARLHAIEADLLREFSYYPGAVSAALRIVKKHL